VFLEMTTLKQRLVRKKNRKLRRLRELYPDIRIKLFYARDFRAMMLKYGRLGLAESLSGTPGQMVSERAAAAPAAAAPAAAAPAGAVIESIQVDEPQVPSAPTGSPAVAPVPRPAPRSRPGRRRRRPAITTEAGAEREAST
jgi:hypothetical protein